MKQIILLIVAAIFFSSCAPTYYQPKTVNVPLLEKKNDVQISGHMSESSGSLQAAYGLTKNLGVNVDLFRYDKSSSTFNNQYSSVEMGLGYYKPLGSRFHFEVYGISGLGQLSKQYNYDNNSINYPDGSINSKYHLYGIQPSIGIKWKYVELSYTMRLLRNDFYNTNGNLIYNEESEVDYLNRLDYQNIVEQSVTFRVGLEHLKLQFQLTKSKDFGRGKVATYKNTDQRFLNTGNATIGLIYNFNATSD